MVKVWVLCLLYCAAGLKLEKVPAVKEPMGQMQMLMTPSHFLNNPGDGEAESASREREKKLTQRRRSRSQRPRSQSTRRSLPRSRRTRRSLLAKNLLAKNLLARSRRQRSRMRRSRREAYAPTREANDPTEKMPEMNHETSIGSWVHQH